MSTASQPQKKSSTPADSNPSRSAAESASVKDTSSDNPKKVEKTPKKSGSGSIIAGAAIILVLGLVAASVLQNSNGNVSNPLTVTKSRDLSDFETKWSDTFTLEYTGDVLHLKNINKKRFANTPLVEVLEGFTNHTVSTLQGIKNLTIDFPVISSLDLQAFQEVIYFISQFPNLEGLSLDFCSSSRIPSGAVRELFDTIRQKVKDLKYLNLGFFDARNAIDDKALAYIFEIIGTNYTSLKALSLNVGGTDISKKGLAAVIDVASLKLKDLEHLDLDLKLTSVDDQSMDHIARAAADHFSSLRRFKIDCARCMQITDTGFSSLALNICYNLKNLESLSFLFPSVKLTNNAIHALVNDMEHQKNLKELHLDFSNTEEGITEAGLELLFETLKSPQFSNLTHFTLKLAMVPKMSDKLFKALATILGQKLTKLEYLDLSMEQSGDFSIESFKNFATFVGRNLKNLKHLTLNFIGHDGFNDEVIMILGSTLSRNLEYLRIDTLGKKGLSDKGLTTFFDSIGDRLTELKSFSIEIYQYPKVTDKSVVSLANSIKKLHKLEKLVINMIMDKLTEVSPQSLANAFKENPSLQNLEELQIDFSGSQGITNSAAVQLLDTIGQTLHQLKTFRISLMMVNNLKPNFLDALSKNVIQKIDSLLDLKISLYGSQELTGKEFKKLIDEIADYRPNLAVFDAFIGMEIAQDKSLKLLDHAYRRISFIPIMKIY